MKRGWVTKTFFLLNQIFLFRTLRHIIEQEQHNGSITINTNTSPVQKNNACCRRFKNCSLSLITQLLLTHTYFFISLFHNILFIVILFDLYHHLVYISPLDHTSINTATHSNRRSPLGRPSQNMVHGRTFWNSQLQFQCHLDYLRPKY